MSDYVLWKAWWYAALYGASPSARMAALDRLRGLESGPDETLFLF